MRKLNPKPPPPKDANLNLKSTFYVSPFSHYPTKEPPQTSTPCRLINLGYISSIHYSDTDESLANIPDTEKIEQSTNGMIGPKISEPIKQPAFVATRRPKTLLAKRLMMDTKTDDEIVDDVATVSLVNSAMEMSSILGDNENNVKNDAENGDKAMTASTNCFEITNQELKTEENKADSIDMAPPKAGANESHIWLNHSDDKQPTEADASSHQIDAFGDVISVSSSSTACSMAAATNSIANAPKLSTRPKVGFDVSNSIYELSVASQQHESSQKLVMKSGKWRRTIFEARRNKITQCECRCY